MNDMMDRNSLSRGFSDWCVGWGEGPFHLTPVPERPAARQDQQTQPRCPDDTGHAGRANGEAEGEEVGRQEGGARECKLNALAP
jgi:hypothetical protein